MNDIIIFRKKFLKESSTNKNIVKSQHKPVKLLVYYLPASI